MAPNPSFGFSKSNYIRMFSVCLVSSLAFEMQHSAVQKVITYISEEHDNPIFRYNILKQQIALTHWQPIYKTARRQKEKAT